MHLHHEGSMMIVEDTEHLRVHYKFSMVNGSV